MTTQILKKQRETSVKEIAASVSSSSVSSSCIQQKYDCNLSVQMMHLNDIYKMKLLLPYFQRIVDICKIKEICQNQIDHFRKKQCFHFNCISVCYDLSEKIYYLIDGQHRFKAAEIIQKEYGHDNIYLPVQITVVESTEEMQHYYDVKNMNTPLPTFDYSEFDKDSLQKICTRMQYKYPQVFSGNFKCHRPAIYFNYFQEAVRYIQRNLSITDEEVIELLEEHNHRLKNYKFEDFKQNITIKMYNQAREWEFYLGLFFFDPEEEYVCYWANYIVLAKQGLGLPEQKKSKGRKKKSMYKTLRESIWCKNVGTDKNEHYCIVCHRSVISALNFHAGHIISEQNGGETNEDNVIPICSSCNQSMGTINMDAFILKVFPKNYESFKNRQYDRVVNFSSNSSELVMINEMDTPAKRMFGYVGKFIGVINN